MRMSRATRRTALLVLFALTGGMWGKAEASISLVLGAPRFIWSWGYSGTNYIPPNCSGPASAEQACGCIAAARNPQLSYPLSLQSVNAAWIDDPGLVIPLQTAHCVYKYAAPHNGSWDADVVEKVECPAGTTHLDDTGGNKNRGD